MGITSATGCRLTSNRWNWKPNSKLYLVSKDELNLTVGRILVRKTLEGVLTYPIIPLSAQVKVIHLSNINHIRDHSTLSINQLSCVVVSATFFVSQHPILVDFKYEHIDLLCLPASGVVFHRMNSVWMNSVMVNSVRVNNVGMNSVNGRRMNSVDRWEMNSVDRWEMNIVDVFG
ncbi:hypothetical protein F2Q69_00015700 [Brassica cretica]|uniref:Uncharacterized protein n=1 Tax=Brassica cretica TaxID=69181 RepID=A0A8S9R472_BRACR|nr:hypothetical protein F2Q69_00015700 [Brassica cretica]